MYGPFVELGSNRLYVNLDYAIRFQNTYPKVLVISKQLFKNVFSQFTSGATIHSGQDLMCILILIIYNLDSVS